VVEFLLLLMMVGALVLVAAPWFRRRRGGSGVGNDAARGQLLVTGLSPPPDNATGEQWVTITGVINGPTVNEHVVYQQMAVDVNNWPTMGQLFPVVYSAKNPDKWNFAPPDSPPPDSLPPDYGPGPDSTPPPGPYEAPPLPPRS
jgi:hypothetical protein